MTALSRRSAPLVKDSRALYPVLREYPMSFVSAHDPNVVRTDAGEPSGRSYDAQLLELLLEASTDGVMDWNLVENTVRYTPR